MYFGHESSSWVELRLHTENQLTRCYGGKVKSTNLNWVRVGLGWIGLEFDKSLLQNTPGTLGGPGGSDRMLAIKRRKNFSSRFSDFTGIVGDYQVSVFPHLLADIILL